MDPIQEHFIEFEAAILKLDPTAYDCRLKIADVRRQMDKACDVGKISLAQWRTLLERVAHLQSRCIPEKKGNCPAQGGNEIDKRKNLLQR